MLFSVEKMTCGHCVRAVTNAVRSLDPRAQVDVDLAGGKVRIAGQLEAAAAAQAIREEGYAVRVIEG